MDLNDVIRYIDSGEWLSLSVVKCNAKKNVAGEIMHLRKCRIARRQPGAVSRTAPASGPHKQRHANHSWNFTRNLELPNRSIITIHPLFVFTLNNQPVL